MDDKAIFNHAKFDRACDRLRVLSMRLDPGMVILLTGPSGSGKTMITEIMEQWHRVPTSSSRTCAVQPVQRVLARNYQNNGYFSTRDLWMPLLKQMDHPLVSGVPSLSRVSTSELMSACEEALIALQTRFLIIDEAQEIRQVKGGDKNAQKILDSLKSFAAETGVILVLSGAYPLMATVDLGPHLSRRTFRVIMHRYYDDRAGDLAEFTKIVQHFSGVMGLDFSAQIQPILPEIYRASLGVIGMVKDTLLDISTHIDQRSTKSPDIELLRDIVSKMAPARSICDEVKEGERYLKSRALDFGELPDVPTKGQRIVRRSGKKHKTKARPRDYTKTSVFE